MGAPLRFHKLSARSCATISTPGRWSDGGGLYLAVDPSGARRWVFLYKFNKRQTEMGIGPFHVVSLADARDEAAAARQLLRRGIDPLTEKRAARGVARAASIVADGHTFGQCADEFIAAKSPEWKNAKHADQWRSTLGEPCRAIRNLPVASIDTAAVLAVLTPLWAKTPETASRLRGRIEAVLGYAIARGWRTGENCARWQNHLSTILPSRGKLDKSRHASMPWRDVPAFYAGLDDGVPAEAFRFLIATASRLGEVLGARWDEIDLAARTWTIPANRMKASVEHVIPLSQPAVDVLARVGAGRQGELVFPGRNDRPLSDTTLRPLLNSNGFTIHGFRASFRTWAGDTGVDRMIAEACLAHANGNKVEAAYLRTTYLEQRRVVLESWATLLTHGG